MPETDVVFCFLQRDRLTENPFLAAVAMIALVALACPAAGIFSTRPAGANEPVRESMAPGGVDTAVSAAVWSGSFDAARSCPFGYVSGDDGPYWKVNAPDMVVMPSTEASTCAVVWWVSASTCIRHPG